MVQVHEPESEWITLPECGEIITTVETITPEIAAAWLAQPANRNRPISRDVVRRYAAMMTAGEWKLDGAPIRFSADGRLLDGQHRLSACVLAGVSFRSVVMMGVDPAAFTVMDTGRRRGGSDALAITGEVDTTTLAAAIRAVLAYEAGLLFTSSGGRGASAMYSNQQVLDAVAAHPRIRESLPYGRLCGHLMSRSRAAAAHYLTSKHDALAADRFFNTLASGLNMSETEPVYALRKRLEIDRVKRVGRMGEAQISELVARAWNATRQNRTMKHTTIGKDAASARDLKFI